MDYSTKDAWLTAIILQKTLCCSRDAEDLSCDKSMYSGSYSVRIQSCNKVCIRTEYYIKALADYTIVVKSVFEPNTKALTTANHKMKTN